MNRVRCSQKLSNKSSSPTKVSKEICSIQCLNNVNTSTIQSQFNELPQRGHTHYCPIDQGLLHSTTQEIWVHVIQILEAMPDTSSSNDSPTLVWVPEVIYGHHDSPTMVWVTEILHRTHWTQPWRFPRRTKQVPNFTAW